MKWLVFFAAVISVLGSGMANLLQETHPWLATVFNPLNTEARINHLLEQWRNGAYRDAQRLQQMEQDAQAIVRLSPADARGYSLLGNIRLQQNRKEEALALYRQALKQAPTERNALLHLLQEALQQDDWQQAVAHLDILLRRWPDALNAVVPLLNALAANETASSLLARRLHERPPWRYAVIRSLLNSQQGTALVRRVLLQEHAAGKRQPSLTDEINVLIGHYLQRRQVLPAYSLFLRTLTEQERRVAGYVFDSRFSLPFTNRHFTWRVSHIPYVELIHHRPPPDSTQGSLTLQFQDAPVKLGNIRQRLTLLPGQYVLRVRYSSRSLTAPKGLYWQVACAGTGGVRGRLNILPGNRQQHLQEAAFSIPAMACDSQWLELRTGVMTPTWRARYRGQITFHEVSITRMLEPATMTAPQP